MNEHFLSAVAGKLEPGPAEQLLRDIASSSAQRDGDFVRIKLHGYARPEYTGHSSLPFEGRLRDCRDGPLRVLVNIDQNCRLLELEFVWWEHSSAGPPDWTTLEIVPEPQARALR